MATCSANTLLQTAASNGYFGLDDRSLKIAALQLLCSGGSGATAGVGSPVGVVTPGASVAIYFDTSTGQQWNWYNGQWNT